MVGQLLSNPRVMLLAAAVLVCSASVPGMLNLVFLLFTAALLACLGGCVAANSSAAEPVPVKMPENTQAVEDSSNDVQLKIRWDGSGLPSDPDGRFPAGWRTAWPHPQYPEKVRL